MLIGAIDCGFRIAQNVLDSPQRWYSAGLSMGGDVTMLDFGHTEQEITLLVLVSEATKNSLKSYLLSTIKTYNPVVVTPDASDDLQLGGTPGAAVTVIFTNFQAAFQAYNVWECTITVKKYT